MKRINKAAFKTPEFISLKNQISSMIKLDILQAVQSERNPEAYKYRPKERILANGRKYNTPGSVFAKYYKSLSTEKKEKMYSQIENILNDSNVNSLKSKIGTFDLKSSSSVLDQISTGKFLSKMEISDAPFKDIFIKDSPVYTPGSGTSSSESSSVTVTVPTTIKEVDFILNSVECRDETNPEWVGKDDIYMGGNAIDDKGETYKLSYFEVGKFNDDDEINYSGGKYLKRFYPGSSYAEDKLYMVQLFLIEKDSGGASEFLSDAYDATKDYIEEIMMTAGVGALSAALASALPSVGTSLIALVAAIAATLAVLLIAELIRLLASALEDDIFVPTDDHMSAITLESSTDTLDGASEMSDYMTFEGYDGKYRVHYTWKLVKS